jgi:hypothetical protein
VVYWIYFLEMGDICSIIGHFRGLGDICSIIGHFRGHNILEICPTSFVPTVFWIKILISHTFLACEVQVCRRTHEGTLRFPHTRACAGSEEPASQHDPPRKLGHFALEIIILIHSALKGGLYIYTRARH